MLHNIDINFYNSECFCVLLDYIITVALWVDNTACDCVIAAHMKSRDCISA